MNPDKSRKGAKKTMPYKITKSTPLVATVIQGETYEVPAPFAEGHPLSHEEATSMNQTFRENIRNNIAAKIKALKEAGTFDGTDFQAELFKYCSDYTFGLRPAGVGGSRDPVRTEAMRDARDRVKAAYLKRGMKLKDIPAAEITAKAAQALEKYPQILESAKKTVEARKQAVQDVDIDLE